MKKRKSSLLQRMMEVLLSAVLVAGMASNAAAMTVLAQFPEGEGKTQESVSGNAAAEGGTKPVEGTETEQPLETESVETKQPENESRGRKSAKSNGASGEGWTLDENGKLTISSAAGMAGSWGGDKESITSIVIQECGLTIIESNLFSNCSNLKSVTLPDGVTDIMEGAFSGCSGLTSVTLPNTLKNIGDIVFSGCSSLAGITLPDTLETIGSAAFSGCSSLTSIALPDKLKVISPRMFSECSSLTSVTLPNELETLGARAFSECSSLNEITIPAKVESIMGWVFDECSSLTKVTMLGETPPTAGGKVFSGCKFVTDNTKGIYVPTDKVQAYQQAWTAWAGYITHEHSWSSDWTTNETHHWHVCTIPGCPDENAKGGYEEHDYDNDSDMTCNTCGYDRTSLDTQPPAGTIKIGENSWTGFLNEITFGLFFKETKQITIEAEDAGSGVDKNYYYISDRKLTETEVKTLGEADWTEGASVSVRPDRKCVIYAKITDQAGNETYLSSNGLVFDGTAPVITGVTDGGSYQTPQEVTVSDANLESVVIVNKSNFPLEGRNSITFTVGGADENQTIAATDKAGNTTAVTVTVEAASHTHNYGEWQQDDTQHWKECACGEETGRANHDYGDWITGRPATAADAGTKYRECRTCHYRETETVPATGTEPESGTVTPEIKPGVNAPEADISTPTEELEDMLLTEEEKRQLQNGINIKIVLEVQDAGSCVSDADKENIKQALNGLTVGQYLNIDLYKLVGGNRTDVTEAAEKIRIVITVPDSLKNTDSGKTREFAVIRIHGGKAELLPDLDSSADTITIETDRFSTYAIVYKDTSDGGSGDNNGDDGNSSNDNPNNNNGNNDTKPDSSKDNEPETGDSAPLEPYATLAMIAGFAYLLLYFRDRKRGMTEKN